jgi:hypothetical protein
MATSEVPPPYRQIRDYTLRNRVFMDTSQTLPGNYPAELADAILYRPVLTLAQDDAMTREMDRFLDVGLENQHWKEASRIYHEHMVYATFDRKRWIGRDVVYANLQAQFDMMKGGKYDDIVEWERSGSRIMMRAANTWISASNKIFTVYIATSFYFVFSEAADGSVEARIILIVDTGDRLHFYTTIGEYFKDDALHGGSALKRILAHTTTDFVQSLYAHVPSIKDVQRFLLYSSPLKRVSSEADE